MQVYTVWNILYDGKMFEKDILIDCQIHVEQINYIELEIKNRQNIF